LIPIRAIGFSPTPVDLAAAARQITLIFNDIARDDCRLPEFLSVMGRMILIGIKFVGIEESFPERKSAARRETKRSTLRNDKAGHRGSIVSESAHVRDGRSSVQHLAF